MKMRWMMMMVTSGLVAACGGSETQPAQTSYDARTTSGRVDETTTTTTAAPAARSTSTINAPVTNAPSPEPSTTTSASTSGSTTPLATIPPPPATKDDTAPADRTGDADNTRINERDRHGTVTPMDQGGSKEERRITADIRKSVVADGSLSFTAKNVKIITVGTKVTLRGPVKSEAEKQAIEAHAKRIPGVTAVDDQLEIAK